MEGWTEWRARIPGISPFLPVNSPTPRSGLVPAGKIGSRTGAERAFCVSGGGFRFPGALQAVRDFQLPLLAGVSLTVRARSDFWAQRKLNSNRYLPCPQRIYGETLAQIQLDKLKGNSYHELEP